MLQFQTHPCPTGNAEVDTEIQSLQRTVRMAAKDRETQMLRGGSPEHFSTLFPPNVRTAMDRINEYQARYTFSMMDESIQKKWLSLHDAFQDVPVDMECPVGIVDLKSSKGQLLNGTIGTSLGKRGTGTNEGRFQVSTTRKDGETGEVIKSKLWIKKENLKTVYGTERSNVFDCGLFEELSRINHSCCPNTTMVSVNGLNDTLPMGMKLDHAKPEEQALVSERDIKAGEEITLSYLGARNECRSTEIRRETLLEKYCFACKCKVCEKNELC